MKYYAIKPEKTKNRYAARLEIVPVRVVRFSRPRIRCSHDARDASALRPASSRPRAEIHLWYALGLTSCAPSAVLYGNSTAARASCLWLLALLDDLDFRDDCGWERGRCVVGMGVRSTHSSFKLSSRLADSDNVLIKSPLWSDCVCYYVYASGKRAYC